MKRTPLKRGKPLARKGSLKRSGGLKRTRMVRKLRKNDRPELRREYAETHPTCACCGTNQWLQCHHILNGKHGRKDDFRNFLMLCGWACHPRAEGEHICGPDGERLPKLEMAEQLFLKRESDPQWYDEEWLRKVRGRPLPEPTAPTNRTRLR